MSQVDLHPEDLLDRERAGALSHDERARLDAHCAVCEACAMERLLSAPLAPSAEDEALIAALCDDGLLDAIAEEAARPPARPRTPWLSVAASVAVLLLTFGGGAYAAVRAGWLPNPLAEDVEEAPAESPRRPRARAEPAPEVEAAPEDTPQAEPSVAETPEAAPRHAPRVSAEELYAQANAARRAGEHRRALGLYRQLSRQHPRSRQARTSQVAAGNLALHELGDPRAALRHFDRYLAGSASGPLALEARVGRALALSRLGRRGPERRAWQAILEHHPTSVHAERARRRLEELR